jgi:hypothetical protein
VINAKRHDPSGGAGLAEPFEHIRLKCAQRHLRQARRWYSGSRRQTIDQPSWRVVIDVTGPNLMIAAEEFGVEVMNLEAVALGESDHPR